MLARAPKIQWFAILSKKPQRAKTTASKEAAVKLTIRPITLEKNGRVWVTYLVQGWKENGKWQCRKFEDEGKAKKSVAEKAAGLENAGRIQALISSSLNQEQHDAARAAFDRLGTAYTRLNGGVLPQTSPAA